MYKALILTNKPLLARKEEQALVAANVQLTSISKFHEKLLNNGHGDYDIIVIDESLRGVDVYETCRWLRGASEAFIILLGTRPSWEMWEKGDDLGFDRYYKKPLASRELGVKIKLATYELGYRNKPEPPEIDDELADVEAIPEEPVQLETAPPEAGPVPTSPAPAASGPAPQQEALPENAKNIWQDPKIAGVMSGLLNGKVHQLSPVIDLSLADGFSYPEVDAVLGTTGRETALTLESLAKEGLLVKQDFDRILLSPAGSMQLVPVERCPQCDSSELKRGELIEHFNCGYIGLEEEFTDGLKQFCPKCKRELKLIGTDYRKPGLRYVCKSCHGVFPSPVIKFRCLKTGEIYPLQELRYLRLYSYRLNEAYRKRLEFELEPKRQLIECLVHLGYDVREGVQVKGRSGATHTIDMVAGIDDLLIRHTVAIGILASPNDKSEVSLDALFGFDSKAYDAGIENKMVIGVPGFSAEALRFAERQGIRVYRLEDLKALLGEKIPETEIISIRRGKEQIPDGPKQAGGSGPAARLKWLLETRGYRVIEQFKLTGRSGAEHVLEIYAEKDDGIINHKLAACVITNVGPESNDVNEVIKFDAAAYDAHIRDKIVISVPRLSKEARQFAEYQRIRVLEANELADLFHRCETEDTNTRFTASLSN
jgi:CheY-like chemotaxis protein